MPTLTIDGKKCEFEGKKMILQVALENDIELPHYCYHPGLSIVASCRICLAEVAQPNPRNENKVELVPKLLPTCQTPATDGMEVFTQSPKSIANQKAVMEYLLINHPLDCPVCDQAGECHLQDYSYQFGRAQSRFREDKIKQPKKDLGPNVLLYSDRCIMCSRCVRFTREVSGTNEIGVFGRGNREQIDVFPGIALENELSANVIDLCPVGALLDKDFLMSMRVWNLESSNSIDGITASGDNIRIDHNDGKIYRIKPRTNMDVNKWWISDEIRYGWKFVHSEKRLQQPARQQLGSAVDCDWDQAYTAAVNALRKSVEEKGEGSLALMASPMLSCEDAYLLAKVARAIDPNAILALGPVPIDGQDMQFPGGYTVYAEKCPNARGVRRALQAVAGSPDAVLDYDALTEKLADKKAGPAAVIFSGNYPTDWVTKDLTKLLMRKTIVLLDTLDSPLVAKANVLLPSCTWAEKSGAFENANGRLQSFQTAIAPLEGTRPEAQIAMDLLAQLDIQTPARFDAPTIRQQMTDALAGPVQEPAAADQPESEMVFVEL